MSIQKETKVIIVGGGVFGLSTSLHMCQAGYTDVTIYDYQPYDENAYDPDKGCDAASADVNKIIRCTYGDELEYQDLAYSGRSIWQEWNKRIAASSPDQLPKGVTPDTTLFYSNGFLRVATASSLGPYDEMSIDQLEKSGLRTALYLKSSPGDRTRLSALDKEEPEQHWSHKFDIFSHLQDPDDGKPLECYLDTLAGFVRSDKACTYARYLCERAGVKFVLGKSSGKLSRLLETEANGEKIVTGIETADGVHHLADLVIVAAGAWTPSIVPDLQHVLEATAGTVVTIQIPKDRPDLLEKYAPENFPVIAFGLTGHESPVYGGLYGFPRTETGQIKIGYRGRKWTNFQNSPVTGQRVSVPRTAFSENPIDNVPKIGLDCVRTFIETFWPDLKDVGVSKTRLCWYTDSSDNNFVIDYVPGYKKSLFVCSGGSGHGFKFLPVLGKHVLNQIEERQDEFTALWKFKKPTPGASHLNGLEEGESGDRVLARLALAQQADWTWPVREVIDIAMNTADRLTTAI